MAHKHSHVHRRQANHAGILDLADGLDHPADDSSNPLKLPKRVVTIYKTETPEGWAGGVLTTLERATTTQIIQATVTSTQPEDDDATPTLDDDVPEETAAEETADRISAKVTPTSSPDDDDNNSALPTAIVASTASRSDTAGALAMASETPMSTSSLLSKTTAEITAADSTATGSTAASAASATDSASTSSASSSSSSGTKAGIAIGVLAGIFIVLAMVYVVIRKRKRQMREDRLADDEKLGGPFETGAPAAPAKAPRLSLRPMTQLFMGGPGDRRVSKAPQQAMAMAAGPAKKRAPGAADAWERPTTSDSQNVSNPFGSHAETILEEPSTPVRSVSPLTPNSETGSQILSPTSAAGLTPAPQASAITTNAAVPAQAAPVSPPRSPSQPEPQGLPNVVPPSPLQGNPLQVNPVGQAISPPTAPEAAATFAGATAGATLGVAAVSGLQRKQSVRKENDPAPLDLTLPPKMEAVPASPTGTEFSYHEAESSQTPSQPSAGAAAIAAAGGPADSTVHRVQLDFKPTMDDELELRAGQLVRLLHEYDDGWALCIRLDRSQQGVVPRTCLSTRPVKPRNPQQGGPRGPPGMPQGKPRGPPVSNQRGPGPNLPPGNRPMGPPGRPQGPPGSGQRGPGPNYPPGSRPMGPSGRPPMGPPGRPPMGPGPRPQSPAMQRPQSPAMKRPQSPAMKRPQSPAMQRPQSPAGQRSQSPGPQGRPGQPQSPTGASQRQSPPGPSSMSQEYRPASNGPSPGPPPQGLPQGPPQGVVTRKPVPGQAY